MFYVGRLTILLSTLMSVGHDSTSVERRDR